MGKPSAAFPPNLPVATARLPATYEKARAEIAACHRVDECKSWSDKMAALAAYARMSEDDDLEKMAMRIRARAIRRCGELLEQWQTSGKGGPPKKGNGTATDPVSQRQAAATAGLSKRQEKQARRVASIPEPEFEAAVGGDNPPTIAALANGETTEMDFSAATKFLGALERLSTLMSETDPATIFNGLVNDQEREHALMTAFFVSEWLTNFARENKCEIGQIK